MFSQKQKVKEIIMIETFNAFTIHCVCQKIRSMFRVLRIYNFDFSQNFNEVSLLSDLHTLMLCVWHLSHRPNRQLVVLCT